MCIINNNRASRYRPQCPFSRRAGDVVTQKLFFFLINSLLVVKFILQHYISHTLQMRRFNSLAGGRSGGRAVGQAGCCYVSGRGLTIDSVCLLTLPLLRRELLLFFSASCDRAWGSLATIARRAATQELRSVTVMLWSGPR